MSSVEFQAGIQSITVGADAVKVTIALPNASAQDAALVAWLTQAQRQNSLHTVAMTAETSDPDAERQLRLFEDLMVEAAPNALSRIAAAALTGGRRRNGLTKVASGPIENDPAPTGYDTAESEGTQADYEAVPV